MSQASQTRKVSPYLVLAGGVLAVSSASTLIRFAQTEVPSLAIAAWRMTLAALGLALPAWRFCRAEWRALDRRAWAWLVGAGFFLAVHFAAWITSLAMTTVAASVVLVTMNPLFVGIASWLILHERLERNTVLGILLGIGGAVAIALSDAQAGGAHRLAGDVLALLGALAASSYFMVGRHLRPRLSLIGYVFPVYAMAAVWLMLFAGFNQVPLSGYSPRAWLWLVLLALGPQIVGHSTLNWALKHLTATFVTLAVLGEPLLSALLAWGLFHEVPSPLTLVGGGLVLAGIVVGSQKATTEEPTDA